MSPNLRSALNVARYFELTQLLETALSGSICNIIMAFILFVFLVLSAISAAACVVAHEVDPAASEYIRVRKGSRRSSSRHPSYAPSEQELSSAADGGVYPTTANWWFTTSTTMPTILKNGDPRVLPTQVPSAALNSLPTAAFPSLSPSQSPSAASSPIPSTPPSSAQDESSPSAGPISSPVALPLSGPSVAPSVVPSFTPSSTPIATPSSVPSVAPSTSPSLLPSTASSASPSPAASLTPAHTPSLPPSSSPFATPSSGLTVTPSEASSVTPSSPPVAFPSSAPSHVLCAPFNLTLLNIGTAISTSVETAFREAQHKWNRLIKCALIPLPPFTLGVNQCGNPAPITFPAGVNDVAVLFSVRFIDGPSNVLGQASPCFARFDSLLPYMGYMELDSADIDDLVSQGLLVDVIVHEIGHILGIASWLWTVKGCLQNPSSVTVKLDTHYTCSAGITAFNTVGGQDYTASLKVPVENGGGFNNHWRESVFQNELMSPFIGPGYNPLSIVSLAALADAGYIVNYAAADPYTLPTFSRKLESVYDLGDDLLKLPIYIVNPSNASLVAVLLYDPGAPILMLPTPN